MISKSQFLKVIIVCIIAIIGGLIIPIVSLFFFPNLDILSQYATFNGYFLSLVNLIVVGFISYLVYDTTNRFNQFQMTTILEMMVDPEKDEWHLINCSNVAARNISVRFSMKTLKTRWIACYSLAGQGNISLPWIRYADNIEICFSDYSLTKYRICSYQLLGVQNVVEIKKEDYDKINNGRLNSVDVSLRFKEFLPIWNKTELGYWQFYREQLLNEDQKIASNTSIIS